MKVSKRDISILLIALGIIGAFAVFQFYFRSALKNKDSIEEENKTLEARLDKLFSGKSEDEMITEMGDSAEKIKNSAAIYPSRYLYEDLLMYLYDWQELPYEELYNFPQYTITENDEESIASVTGVFDWDPNKREAVNATFQFGKAVIDTTYKTSNYKGFKYLINKIYLSEDPKSISSVTALMERDTGYVGGNLVVDFYTANGEGLENEREAVKIEGVKTGQPNIFGPTYTPTPTPSPTPDPKQLLQKNNDD